MMQNISKLNSNLKSINDKNNFLQIEINQLRHFNEENKVE
jgi:regulator of replication initiation timing